MQRHSRYLALLITELAKQTDIYSDSGVEGLLSLVLLISLYLILLLLLHDRAGDSSPVLGGQEKQYTYVSAYSAHQ